MSNSVAEKTKSILAPVDIYETKDEYILQLDMPGVRKEDISIVFKDSVLELKGDVPAGEPAAGRAYCGEFSPVGYYRSFTVGNDIDSDGISAKSENGVLSVILKKKEQAKPKKIEVLAS